MDVLDIIFLEEIMRGFKKQGFPIGLFCFLHPFVIFSTYHLFKRNRFQLPGDKMQIISVLVILFHRGESSDLIVFIRVQIFTASLFHKFIALVKMRV